jgi:hypothetical protein
MTDDSLQRRADELAERVEALAEALRAGDVPEGASAQLLSSASAAVLQALRLELLLEQAEHAKRTDEPASVDHGEVETAPLLAA